MIVLDSPQRRKVLRSGPGVARRMPACGALPGGQTSVRLCPAQVHPTGSHLRGPRVIKQRVLTLQARSRSSAPVGHRRTDAATWEGGVVERRGRPSRTRGRPAPAERLDGTSIRRSNISGGSLRRRRRSVVSLSDFAPTIPSWPFWTISRSVASWPFRIVPSNHPLKTESSFGMIRLHRQCST